MLILVSAPENVGASLELLLLSAGAVRIPTGHTATNAGSSNSKPLLSKQN
jgi:hypothetical protein